MQAATGVAAHEDVAGGVEGVEAADGTQVVRVPESFYQHALVAEQLDLKHRAMVKKV